MDHSMDRKWKETYWEEKIKQTNVQIRKLDRHDRKKKKSIYLRDNAARLLVNKVGGLQNVSKEIVKIFEKQVWEITWEIYSCWRIHMYTFTDEDYELRHRRFTGVMNEI